MVTFCLCGYVRQLTWDRVELFVMQIREETGGRGGGGVQKEKETANKQNNKAEVENGARGKKTLEQT